MPAFKVFERSYIQSSISTSCKLFTQLPAMLLTRVLHGYELRHVSREGSQAQQVQEQRRHACLSEEDHSSKDFMF